MSAESDIDVPTQKTASKAPMLLGVLLSIAGGAAGFFAVKADAIPFLTAAETEEQVSDAPAPIAASQPEFLPLDPVIISIATAAGRTHLQFRAELEIAPGHQSDVAALTPRIIDVMNGYLRALDLEDLEDPTILLRLRAQLLHRIQVVTGPGKVNDLLVMEFVLS